MDILSFMHIMGGSRWWGDGQGWKITSGYRNLKILVRTPIEKRLDPSGPPMEHSAILSTCTKLPPIFKT